MDKIRAKERGWLEVHGVAGWMFSLAWFFWVLSLFISQTVWAEPISFQEQLNRDISTLFRSAYRKKRAKERGSIISESESEESASFSNWPHFKCAISLLRQARRHQELLYPENRFILYRPSNSLASYYGAGVEVWSYDTPPGHFRLFYTEDNSYGDAVKNMDGLVDGRKETIPEYVLRFGQYFEQAWSYLTDTLGYRAPGESGRKIEVFILDIGSYGSTNFDGTGLYIIVDNDFREVCDNLDPEGKTIGAMKITAAHEFFHIVQADYDHWPQLPDENLYLWWEENTATWIEDELHDEVNDYLNYLGWPYLDQNDSGRWDSGELHIDIWGKASSGWRESGWFDYPYISLDGTSDNSECSVYEYGGVIWAKFLSEHFGPSIVRSIFERIQEPSADIFLAIDESIREAERSGLASFSEAFIRFKLANLRRNYHDYGDYEEGERYPVPLHQGTYSTYPIRIEAESLNYLSCRYYAFQKPPSGQALRLRFEGLTMQAQLAVLAISATSYGKSPLQFGTPQLIPLDHDQAGDYDFSFSQNQGHTKLIIAPINLSMSAKGSYNLTVQTIAEAALPPTPQGLSWSCRSVDGHPVVILSWQDIQGIGQYQIWRGPEDGVQALIFPAQRDDPQPYQDSNSFEDSDPALEFQKSYLYQVKLVNAAGSSSSAVIVVRTSTAEEYPQNHSPVFNPVAEQQEVFEGRLLTFTITATDPDRDAIVYSASNLPHGAVFNPELGEFSWQPAPGQEGSYAVTFTATDNGSTPLSSSLEVIIIVHSGQSAPVQDGGGAANGESSSVNKAVNKAECFIKVLGKGVLRGKPFFKRVFPSALKKGFSPQRLKKGFPLSAAFLLLLTDQVSDEKMFLIS